jgi:hypothetical protein
LGLEVSLVAWSIAPVEDFVKDFVLPGSDPQMKIENGSPTGGYLGRPYLQIQNCGGKSGVMLESERRDRHALRRAGYSEPSLKPDAAIS